MSQHISDSKERSSQDEGTVTEFTTHEVFEGTGNFGEGREDVNIEGNTPKAPRLLYLFNFFFFAM